MKTKIEALHRLSNSNIATAEFAELLINTDLKDNAKQKLLKQLDNAILNTVKKFKTKLEDKNEIK